MKKTIKKIGQGKDSSVHAFLTGQTLVDLHLHLGSATLPDFLWQLAHEQGLALPVKSFDDYLHLFELSKRSYDVYLELFDLTERIQSSPMAVEKSVYHVFSTMYDQGISVVELRFNPMLHNQGGKVDLDRIIYAALEGMKKARLDFPLLRAGIILIMDRRFSPEQNLIIAQKAAKFAAEGVIAIDLAGPIRQEFHIKSVLSAIQVARKAGLKVTLHTGEITGVEEMREVVAILRPDRIGHGIKAVTDEKFMDMLSEKGIVLEICPSSNVQTGVVKKWGDFRKIFQLLDHHHVRYTINSDGPVFLHTNVKNELEKLIKKGLLSHHQVKKILKTAQEASFLS